jgi:putative acetyltransferase
MSEFPEIQIQPFRAEDQAEVKALVLAGLVDHWGVLDLTKNPDLNEIAVTYAHAIFLVARRGGRIVGAGALLPRGNGVAEVVRMSVARDLRRRGIGRLILGRLLDQARADGYRRIVLETTGTWREVISFYLQFGFRGTHTVDRDTYFALEL